MSDQETAPDELTARAAEVAAEVAETDQPQEQRRLAAAFTKAAASSARVAGRGTRAAQRGMGRGVGAARRKAGLGPGWLAG